MQQLISFLRDARHIGVRGALVGLVQRFSRSTLKCPLPNGMSITIRGQNSDYLTVRQIFVAKEYELISGAHHDRLKTVYKEILSSGRRPVIVDSGANIGAAAMWFRSVWPDAVIVCVEPDSNTADILEVNISLLKNCHVLRAAIGAQGGHVAVSVNGEAWATQTIRAESGVKVVTMADAAAIVPNGALFISKVDIEGFEEDLFSSNLDWLEQVSAVFIEPHDWMLPGRGTSRNFQRAFANKEFEMLVRGENLIYVR